MGIHGRNSISKVPQGSGGSSGCTTGSGAITEDGGDFYRKFVSGGYRYFYQNLFFQEGDCKIRLEDWGYDYRGLLKLHRIKKYRHGRRVKIFIHTYKIVLFRMFLFISIIIYFYYHIKVRVKKIVSKVK